VLIDQSGAQSLKRIQGFFVARCCPVSRIGLSRAHGPALGPADWSPRAARPVAAVEPASRHEAREWSPCGGNDDHSVAKRATSTSVGCAARAGRGGSIRGA